MGGVGGIEFHQEGNRVFGVAAVMLPAGTAHHPGAVDAWAAHHAGAIGARAGPGGRIWGCLSHGQQRQNRKTRGSQQNKTAHNQLLFITSGGYAGML